LTRGDASNFAKSTEDALQGIVICDDAQVIDLVVLKRFGPPGVRIIVARLETAEDALEIPGVRE
jgi:Holliday junction resolvase RusA-like endonuclease